MMLFQSYYTVRISSFGRTGIQVTPPACEDWKKMDRKGDNGLLSR